MKRILTKYPFTRAEFASSVARTGDIKSITDYARKNGVKAYDVALDVYDIIKNGKTDRTSTNTTNMKAYNQTKKMLQTRIDEVSRQLKIFDNNPNSDTYRFAKQLENERKVYQKQLDDLEKSVKRK